MKILILWKCDCYLEDALVKIHLSIMLIGACLSDIILRSVDADVLQYLRVVLGGGRGAYLSDSVQIWLTLSLLAENPLN